MYPKLILKIEQHIPSIVFEPEEGMSRVLTSGDENIATTVINIGKELDLVSDSNDPEILFSELLTLATEGDENLIDEVPVLNKDLANFGFEKFVTNEIRKFYQTSENFAESFPSASKDVVAELHRNQDIDVLASALDMIYITLAAKLLLVAQELGVGEIVLDDKDGHARLRERIANELSKMDVELVIE